VSFIQTQSLKENMKIRVALFAALWMLVLPVFILYGVEAGQVSLTQNKEAGGTLQDVLSRFDDNNPRIRILKGKVEAVRAEQHQAGLLPNPELGYRVEDSADRDTFIEAAWPVDFAGRRGLKKKAAQANTDSAENLYQWEINLLMTDVKAHFYELLAVQERLKAAEEGARSYESILNNVRSRSGQTDYDRLRLEKEVLDVKADANEVKRELIQLQTELALLLNENPNNIRLSGDLKSAQTVPSLQTLEASLLSKHPKVISALKQTERRQYERKAARRSWLPQLDLSGGFKNTSGDEIDESGFVAGVSISVPLFDRGQAEYQAADALHKVSEAETVIDQNEIEQRFVRSYQDTVLLKNMVRDYERALLHAEGLEQMAGLAYLEGRFGVLELLDAYRGAIQSRLRSIALALELRLSEIELERITGRSLESLTEEK